MSSLGRKTTRANALAMAAMCNADPILIDVQAAIDVVPNMTPNTILSSGAPFEWSAYTGRQRAAIIGGVTPVMEISVAGRSGGQIGAGVLTAPIACFEFAVKAFQKRYGD
jgi:hypothetical protein|tara:strand:+ start:86 stop:415 length:330 start_codon:yes stop_codon:yes gene_type:complete